MSSGACVCRMDDKFRVADYWSGNRRIRCELKLLRTLFCLMICAMVIDILHVDSVRIDGLHLRMLKGRNGWPET
jgi:hypothetical protein